MTFIFSPDIITQLNFRLKNLSYLPDAPLLPEEPKNFKELISRANTIQELFPIFLDLEVSAVNNSGGFDYSAMQFFYDKLSDIYVEVIGDLESCDSLENLNTVAKGFVPLSLLFHSYIGFYIPFGHIDYSVAHPRIGSLPEDNPDSVLLYSNVVSDAIYDDPVLSKLENDLKYIPKYYVKPLDTSQHPLLRNPNINTADELHQYAVSLFLNKFAEFFFEIFEQTATQNTTFFELLLWKNQDFDNLIGKLAENYPLENILNVPAFINIIRDEQSLDETTLGNFYSKKSPKKILPELRNVLMDRLREKLVIPQLIKWIGEITPKIEVSVKNPQKFTSTKMILDTEGQISAYKIGQLIVTKFINIKGPKTIDPDDVSDLKSSLSYLLHNNEKLQTTLQEAYEKINQARVEYIQSNAVQSVTTVLNGSSEKFMKDFLRDPHTARLGTPLPDMLRVELEANKDLVKKLFIEVLGGENTES